MIIYRAIFTCLHKQCQKVHLQYNIKAKVGYISGVPNIKRHTSVTAHDFFKSYSFSSIFSQTEI